MIAAALGFVTCRRITRLAATLLAGVALGGTLAHQVHRAINDRALVAQQRQTLRTIEAAQAEATRLQEVADHATQKAAHRAQVSARAAAGARAELDRLRYALAAGAPADATACPATAERAATLADLQRECAGALVDLGRKADAHAADALMLYEGWPREAH
jgi:endonuclease/exonuclease/phosphatase (EEP) superfamily protein YafD